MRRRRRLNLKMVCRSCLVRGSDYDPYELLGVERGSGASEIKEAYRSLQKRCHPDIAGPAGHDMAIILNQAYSMLSDPETRSIYDKIVLKMFASDGGDGNNKNPNQVVGEILSFSPKTVLLLQIEERLSRMMKFEGMMIPNRGQATLLTVGTCISLASVALELTITVLEGWNIWFFLTALSPLAGAYYWKRTVRREEIKVKMMGVFKRTVRGDDE